jgi:xanthine phosphoribosyltransferase
MKKLYVSDQEIRDYVNTISFKMYKDDWRPDYIVGLTRGGLIPAVYMSHTLDIPMWTLKVALRDHADTEINAWMAEDAFAGKNILIVDDINDTGGTLDWIIEDWENGALKSQRNQWDNIWNGNVRFAVLFDNLASKFSRNIDYSAVEINKAEEDVWIVYPWER